MTPFAYRMIRPIWLVILIFLHSPIPSEAGYIWFKDFEDSSTTSGVALGTCCHDGNTQTIVTSPVRAGTKAIKVKLESNVLKTDPRVRPDAPKLVWSPSGQIVRSDFYRWGVGPTYGVERWYGISIYIDPSYVDNSADPNGTRVWSMHSNTDPGEPTKTGHLGFILTIDNRWNAMNICDSNAITTSGSATRRIWDIGPLVKGVWVDFVVHAKWSYNNDGSLKIWKDGVVVVDRQNECNTYNDTTLQFLKFGIYKAFWGFKPPSSPQTLTAYFDEIRIGDQTSSYEEVAPRGSQRSTPSAPRNLSVKAD